MRLKSKVVIITGVGQAAGKAIALRFALEGAKVTVNDHDADTCEAVAAEIESVGGQVLCVPGDASQETRVRELVAAAIRRFGRIDILVNNSGGLHVKPLTEIKTDEWDKVIAMHLRSAFLCCREVFPHMRRQGSGTILNISSADGKLGGVVGSAAYSAAKGGLIAFTKAVAREAGPHGIRVNALSPALIDIEPIEGISSKAREKISLATPMGRIGRAEEVAAAACFLVSDEASFSTGEIMDVNGGLVMD